jgi:hypothetical protein
MSKPALAIAGTKPNKHVLVSHFILFEGCFGEVAKVAIYSSELHTPM